MKDNISEEMIIYLLNEIGLNESSIELGLKLSIKKKHSIPSFIMELWNANY